MSIYYLGAFGVLLGPRAARLVAPGLSWGRFSFCWVASGCFLGLFPGLSGPYGMFLWSPKCSMCLLGVELCRKPVVSFGYADARFWYHFQTCENCFYVFKRSKKLNAQTVSRSSQVVWDDKHLWLPDTFAKNFI